MVLILQILQILLNVVWWIIIVQAILSWLIAFNVINTSNDFIRSVWYALQKMTDPLYRPIRRILPDFGALDLSPRLLPRGAPPPPRPRGTPISQKFTKTLSNSAVFAHFPAADHRRCVAQKRGQMLYSSPGCGLRAHPRSPATLSILMALTVTEKLENDI